MYSLYSLQVPKTGAELKKTKPTTVRLYPHLDDWVREKALDHRDGQSGVLNDAVDFYRTFLEGDETK